jgi:hypothetical protein
MQRYLRFGSAVTALLLFAAGVSAQSQSYNLREIFVPQTSQFTQQHPGVIQAFDLSPDGKTLAVEFGVPESGKMVDGWKTAGSWVALWDVDKERLIGTKQIDLHIPHIVWYRQHIRFTADGHMLLVLTGPHLVALSFPDLKILYTFEERIQPDDARNQMFLEGFSAAANRLAILKQYDHNSGHSPSLEVKVTDLETGKVLSRWSRLGLCESIALSPDASLLALTINPGPWGTKKKIPAGENNVFIVRPDSGEIVRAFNSGYAAANSEFLGGSTTLITIPTYNMLAPEDEVELWDAKTGQLKQQLAYPKYGVRGGVSATADGKLLAVAAFWLNPTDVRLDRDNPRGGSRLLIWALPDGNPAYASEELSQEYDLGGLPMSFLLGGARGGQPPVLVRMSASGDRLAFGGQLISVNAVTQEH